MKVKILLTVVGFCMSLGALDLKAQIASQDQELALRYIEPDKPGMQLVSLAITLQDLEEQFDVNFFYETRLIKGQWGVRPESLTGSLENRLADLLSPLGMSFNRLNRKTYTIVSAGNMNRAAIQIRQETVSGRVTDGSTGETLPGVNVLVKGTSSGTATDMDGSFELVVSSLQDTLVFSFIGYQAQEVPIAGRTTLDIELQPQAIMGEEMVVVGYGTQRRRDISGSISSVDAEELQQVKTTSFTESLQGRIPGVQVTATSGAPGAGSSVRIRGVGTTGNNEPLYVVDGFPIISGSMGIPGSTDNIGGLSVINPNDIESIEILKDAAAASIYGARAANGVVLITTKSGSEGRTSVTINSYTGISQVWKKPEVLNAQELAMLANELWENSGMTPHPDFANPEALGEGTDWIDAIFRNAPVSNLDFSVSGGSKNIQGTLSLGALNEKGTLIETGHKRYTGRARINVNTSEILRFGGSFSFTSTQGKGVRNQLHNRGIINLSQQMFPHLQLDDVIGDNVPFATSQADNPVLRAKDQDYRVDNTRFNINGFGEVKVAENLLFKSSLGVGINNGRSSRWDPTADRGHFQNLEARLSENYSRSTNILLENTLIYKASLSDVHRISAVIGQTAQTRDSDWISATGREYLNEQLRVINGSNSSLRQASGTVNKYRLASYLGRINYTYDDRYTVSASLRRDGSSNFGPANKWANFPSASVGWNVSEESFFQVPSINELRVRASWGRLGNDNIGSFGYLSSYSLGSNAGNYILGENQELQVGGYLTRPGNEELKWETSEQINFGIDIGMWGSKVYSTIEYYEKITKDMLVALPVSFEAGFPNAPRVNGGKVLNRGFEFELGIREQMRNLSWSVSANFSTLHNEVLSLGQGQPIPGGQTMYGSGMPITYTEVGQPIGYFKGYIVEGIYQTENEIDRNFQPNAQPGDFQWRDVNNDGVLTDADAVNIGTPWPDMTYGMNIDLAYKNFDFNLMLSGVAGVQIMNKMKESTYPIRYFGGSGIVNANKAALDRWTPEKGGNTIPRLIVDDANGNYSSMSTFYVEDGDFMRIRNVTLGYTLPVDVISRVSLLTNMRVYVTAQNLFTFTKYSGFDPEIQSTNPLSSGIDDGVYPIPRKFLIGLRLSI